MRIVKKYLRALWRGLRSMSGDDAYEKYLRHWHTHHAHEGGAPLDRKTFCKMEMQRRWEGVRRCC